MSRVILVSGGAGVLGSRLVRGLAAGGARVRALVMPGDPLRARLAGVPCEIREGDIEDPASLRAAMAGVDIVYHLAAVILAPDPALFERINRRGTANMVAAAAEAGVSHFIYASSASVTYPRRTPYAESKLAGEALVAGERRFQHTIVRPTLVYDQTGGQEFVIFWRQLERFPVVPFVGDGRALKRPVLSDDIVAGLLLMAGNPRCFGKTYNLSGGEAISIEELGRRMLAVRGVRKRFVHLPVGLCKAAAVVLGALMKHPPLTLQGIAGLVNDADLPPDEAMRDLGYRPLTVREGFARCFPAARDPAERGPVAKELAA